jgi:hypothetical protein
MRLLSVTALVVCALAAGCGADEREREAVDPVAEAAARTAAAGGARFDGQIVYTSDGERTPTTLTGVVDFENERSRTLWEFEHLSPKAEYEAGFPDERIRDRLTIYLSTPLLRDEIGKRWAMFERERLVERFGAETELIGGLEESDPQALLRLLEAAGGAVEAGRARVGGVPTTRYDARISTSKYAELVTGDADPEFRRGFIDAMNDKLGSDTVAASVWLDRDGLIRREQLELTLLLDGEPIETAMRLNFSDFSDSHEVALPEPGDVKDITDEWFRYRVHFWG